MSKQIYKKRFGGFDLKVEYAGFKKSKVVILPCPYEATVTYGKGCSKGPDAILEASNKMELFDDELKKETYKIGIYTKTPLPLVKLSARDMIKNLEIQVSEVLKSKKMPVAIGGEHLISVGTVRAASQIYKDLSVLHLDAHHDLRNDYEGSIYNHACVARRFLEFCPVTQVGVRSLSKVEEDFLGTNPPNLKIIDAYHMRKKRPWKDRVVKSLKDNVYISLDLDIFDPSLMPSVGTPEPGGMGWYELLDLLKTVARNKKIIGFDIVELMPIKGVVAPDFLAAKLIYRLLGYIFYKKEKIV